MKAGRSLVCIALSQLLFFLGTVCLLVLDLCFSALRAKDVLSPFLENILKKKAVYYQARLRIMLDWFGFVPYTAESIEAHPPFSKASLDTTLKSRDCCFGGFFFFLLVLM